MPSTSNTLPRPILSFRVLLNRGDATFDYPGSVASPPFWPTSLAIGDIDADGALDLAVSVRGSSHEFSSTSLWLLPGNGNGSFDAPIDLSAVAGSAHTPSYWTSASIAELNGDSRLDVALLSERRISLLLSSSPATQTPLGDFDNDQDVDDEDYAVWRATYGQAVTPGARADGNGNGVVDAGDYTIWRDNLGAAPDDQKGPSDVVGDELVVVADVAGAVLDTSEAHQAWDPENWWDSPRRREPGPLRERASDHVMHEFSRDVNLPIRSERVLTLVAESRPTRRMGPHHPDTRQDRQRERLLDFGLAKYLDSEL